MKIAYETKIGILGAVTLAILIIGYKYLKGSNIFDQSRIYYTRYKEVDQLDASAPVLVRGIKVGSVTKVMLDPENPNFVLVAMEIKNEIKVPRDAQAVLLSKLIGGKAIEIRFKEHCTDNCLNSRDTITGYVAGALGSMIAKDELQDYMHVLGSELNTILDTIANPHGNTQLAAMIRNLSSTLQSLAGVSNQLNQLLAQSTNNLTQTFANLNQLSGTLAKNSDALATSLQNLESITSSIKKSDPGILISNANSTILDGKKTIQDLDQTIKDLNKVVEKINTGQGSLAKLINDPLLYKNLEKTSKNLDLLMQDIRLNPNRYVNISVFGKKQEPYQNSANDPAEK